LCESGVMGSPGIRHVPTHTDTHTHKGSGMPAVTLATCMAARIHEKRVIPKDVVCVCVCRWAGPPRGEAMTGILITIRDGTGDQYMILARDHKQY